MDEICLACGKPNAGHEKDKNGENYHPPFEPKEQTVDDKLGTTIKLLSSFPRDLINGFDVKILENSQLTTIERIALINDALQLIASNASGKLHSIETLLEKTFVVGKLRGKETTMGFKNIENGSYDEYILDKNLIYSDMEKKIFDRCDDLPCDSFADTNNCIYVVTIGMEGINFVYAGKSQFNVLSRWIYPSKIVKTTNIKHPSEAKAHFQEIRSLLHKSLQDFKIDVVLGEMIRVGISKDQRLIIFVKGMNKLKGKSGSLTTGKEEVEEIVFWGMNARPSESMFRKPQSKYLKKIPDPLIDKSIPDYLLCNVIYNGALGGQLKTTKYRSALGKLGITPDSFPKGYKF